MPIEEKDPNGMKSSDPGAKMDSGKLRAHLVLGDFARALEKVCQVGTVGAAKYTDGGWLKVPEGKKRYSDAKTRHYLRGCYEENDPDLSKRAGTEVKHLAAEIWNGLALLELILREEDTNVKEFMEEIVGPLRVITVHVPNAGDDTGSTDPTGGQNGSKIWAKSIFPKSYLSRRKSMERGSKRKKRSRNLSTKTRHR